MILVPEAEFEHRHEGQCHELKAGEISEELAHQHCYQHVINMCMLSTCVFRALMGKLDLSAIWQLRT